MNKNSKTEAEKGDQNKQTLITIFNFNDSLAMCFVYDFVIIVAVAFGAFWLWSLLVATGIISHCLQPMEKRNKIFFCL